jgi:hypothetical protein
MKGQEFGIEKGKGKPGILFGDYNKDCSCRGRSQPQN